MKTNELSIKPVCGEACFATYGIPLPPEACWVHRFYNNMTAQEHGPWILRLAGFDQTVSSQDLIVLGDEESGRYFLAGALTAGRSTTHLYAHYEFGRFTRLAVWHPELSGADDPETMIFLAGDDWRELVRMYWERALAAHGLERGPVPESNLTGYCSWYYYYDDLSEAQFMENVRAVAANRERFPVRYLQIDDGYQTFHGDWLEQNERWPTPLKNIVAEIRGLGMEAGVWVMPFLASENSRTAREHPDWFVKDDAGRPVYVPGWSAPPNNNWQCLDTTHPEALDYIRSIFAGFREMGVTYFKLDGVGFSGQRGYRRDSAETGSGAFRKGLEAIREAAGDCVVLGCGGNFLAGLGVYDSVRISCDTAINYEPRGLPNKPESRPELPMRHPNPTLPGLENAVRASLCNWFRYDAGYRCDPDVLIARDNHCNLTEAQARMSVLAGLLTGVAFTSDKLDACAPERVDLLGLAARVRVTGVRPHRVEADGNLEVFEGRVGGAPALAFFNFSSEPKRYSVDWRACFEDTGPVVDVLDRGLEPLTDEFFEAAATGGALLVPERMARKVWDAVRDGGSPEKTPAGLRR